MLRLLTAFPPGKVRFTIIDPVGLGQNFAAFMHLADYDEQLVTSRIWTEPQHIEQRLADLTEHMENVIQKYLRNEFETIEEYNEHAGEVAEPFRVLVVANFPANFRTKRPGGWQHRRQRRRCGVYTLISIDAKLALPRNFELADLEAQAATLTWDATQRRFRLEGRRVRPSSRWRSTRRPTPSDSREIVRTVGKLAKDADRVEVPFEFIAAGRATGGRPTAAAGSTCRSAGPGPRSCSTCGSARGRRSTS